MNRRRNEERRRVSAKIHRAAAYAGEIALRSETISQLSQLKPVEIAVLPVASFAIFFLLPCVMCMVAG